MKADFLVDLLPSGSLSLQFPYDPVAVDLVRAITGRQWHKEAKFWSIPRTGLRFLREQAARQGYALSLSEKVQQALNLGREHQAKLLAAKHDESPLDLPTATVPYGFQYAGIRFAKYALHNFHGALIADDLGLGKSFMALSLISLHPKLENVLLLVPNTLKFTWAAQIDEHYPELSYTVIHGPPKLRAEQWNEPSRIKICNYELLLRDMDPRVITWDLVVGDEIAAFLKNYKAQRTKRAKKLKRRYTLGLCGIPLENRLEELHSVMDFIIPGLLGSGWVFVQQHVVRNEYGIFLGYRGIDQIKERIAPYYIRRTKAEVLPELPAKVYNDVSIEMSADEWALYDDIRKQIKEKIAANPKLNVSNILVEMLRLKQATLDPRLLDIHDIPSSKLEAVREMLDAAEGHKVVLFTQFAQLATLLGQELQAPVIQGSVDTNKRAEIIADFQHNGQPVLISTDAGAYGITLTAADIICHLDPTWNPAKMRQREDRLHRIGQKSSVQVVSLICRKTVDEKIRVVLHRKLSLIKAVLDESNPEDDSQRMSKQDLLDLLED